MTKFAEIKPEPPQRVVVVPPSVWADDYAGKPNVEVAIGLRFVSQQDQDVARRQAELEAAGFYAQLRGLPVPSDPIVVLDIHNDTLMCLAVARGTCDPNDVTVPYFKAADEMVKIALTPEGIRRVYDELVILHKGAGSGRRAADDDDVLRLGRVLQSRVYLDDETRKLCAYLLEKLGEEIEDDDEEIGPVLAIARSA